MTLLKHYTQMCRKFHTDIALSRDEASHFLPWIIALMVYLAALVLAGSFTLSSTINASHHAQTQSFSVHLPHPADKEHDLSGKALDLVKETAGVSEAEIITTERLEQMVEPWFGKGSALSSLPLPVIIDAKIIPGASIDFDSLKSKLSLLVPGASIDDHKKWIVQFSSFVGVIQTTLMFIAVLIITSTACMVVFACKTSLKIHRSTVNLLHRLGALDDYIATQFQNHAAFLTLKGAFIGSGFASFTLLGLHAIAHKLDSPLFPAFTLSLMHWLILFTLPLIMSGLALVVARLSVLRSLRRVP